jgi:hypothetical protein
MEFTLDDRQHEPVVRRAVAGAYGFGAARRRDCVESKKEVGDFAWDVRRAINEFLEYARKEGFSKRGKLVAALDVLPRDVVND